MVKDDTVDAMENTGPIELRVNNTWTLNAFAFLWKQEHNKVFNNNKKQHHWQFIGKFVL